MQVHTVLVVTDGTSDDVITSQPTEDHAKHHTASSLSCSVLSTVCHLDCGKHLCGIVRHRAKHGAYIKVTAKLALLAPFGAKLEVQGAASMCSNRALEGYSVCPSTDTD